MDVSTTVPIITIRYKFNLVVSVGCNRKGETPVLYFLSLSSDLFLFLTHLPFFSPKPFSFFNSVTKTTQPNLNSHKNGTPFISESLSTLQLHSFDFRIISQWVSVLQSLMQIPPSPLLPIPTPTSQTPMPTNNYRKILFPLQKNLPFSRSTLRARPTTFSPASLRRHRLPGASSSLPRQPSTFGPCWPVVMGLLSPTKLPSRKMKWLLLTRTSDSRNSLNKSLRLGTRLDEDTLVILVLPSSLRANSEANTSPSRSSLKPRLPHNHSLFLISNICYKLDLALTSPNP